MNIKLFIFLIGSVFFSSCATAQNYPQRSVDGKDYYVHTVEPGNTLFAISRLYSVDVKELMKNNPNAEDGLDIGEEILVPIDAIDKREARKTDIKISGDYLIHTVQKKETLYSLSRQYSVTINDILELNPDADKSLSTGYQLKIPVNKMTDVDEKYIEPARTDSFIVHQVQKGETAYKLAILYNLPLDSLKRANNNFREGMKIGSWITIPVYNEKYQEKLAYSDSVSAAENAANKPGFPVLKGAAEEYNIAMMLPFSLALNDSLDKKVRSGDDLFLLTEISLEFYRGAKMALDSLKKLGLKANVYVYDVGEDVVDARSAVKRPEMQNMHMIFGPMHKASLAVVSEFSRKNKIYLVSPNSFNNEIYQDNPYLMRVEATDETMLKYMANFIAINHSKDNVIMLNSGSSKDWEFRKLFAGHYNKALSSHKNAYRDSIPSVSVGKYGLANILPSLKKDAQNIIVVPSNELAFVSDVMTRLSSLGDQQYRIQVYGLDNWIKYDNIETEYKNRFKLRLPVPNFADYNNVEFVKFLKKFRDEYSSEPSEYGYGFMAYDVTLYFGKQLLQEGLSFPLSFQNNTHHGIYGDYRFGKAPSGTEFENKSVFIVEYDDYNILKVN